MRFCLLKRPSDAVSRLIEALCDPKRRRRTAFLLACGYGAAWLLYGAIAKSSQDINTDMAELVVWSRHLTLGYPKHPPLLAYVVRLWFSIFPLSDWTFIALGAISAALAIFLAFELGGFWLDGEKRAAVPFLLAVVPFYNFFALKFDQNSALIPLWALTILLFLRSLETPRVGSAALAGLSAAAAMLVKYWSLFLLAALMLTVLRDRRRNVYLRSAAPYITAATFVIVMLPHTAWLIAAKLPPLLWVETRRQAQSVWDFIRSLGEYSAGTLGYASVAILLVVFVIHAPRRAIYDGLFATDATRRPATILFWTPLVLPIFVAMVTGTDLVSIWNIPSLNLLPVILLSSSRLRVTRLQVQRLAAIAMTFTLIPLALSPIIALAILKHGVENDALYARLVAAAAEQEWHETTDAPLRFVAGPYQLANPVAFYLPEAPLTYANFSNYDSPDATPAALERSGVVIVCSSAGDPGYVQWCVDHMDALTAAGPPGHRDEVVLVRHWLGFASAPRRFVIAAVPPHMQDR